MNRTLLLTSCTLCLAIASIAPAQGVDDGLVAYFKLDETSGTTAVDSSGQGHDGTVIGTNVTWAEGRDGGALTIAAPATGDVADRLEFPTTGMSTTAGSICVWVYLADPQPASSGRYIFGHTSGTGTSFADRIQLYMQDGTNVSRKLDFGLGGSHSVKTDIVELPMSQWLHLAFTWNNGVYAIYLDGEQIANGSYSSLSAFGAIANFGNDGCGAPYEAFSGMLDEARVYNRALSADQVKTIFKILPSSKIMAKAVAPANKATEVSPDAVLAWTASEFAATHDVYLGTTFDDVNSASRDNPGSVLIGQSQTETELDPEGPLAYGQTYYWRIDEVNAAPDYTIFKGAVWSFTTEPYGYPIADVTATASSAQPGMGPENTVNRSGLDADDQHGTELTTMWMTTNAKPAWIQYEFDKVYKLHELWIWNSNQLIEGLLGFGARNVAVEYSVDGETWTGLEGVPEFAQATGDPAYTANTTVSLAGVMAKFVKLTIEASWGVMPQTGLSEVRFFYVPVQAFEPQPADGATGVSVETDLAWHPGREAASNTVFIGDDSDAVADGSVSGKTTENDAYTPASLEFATTYFWKVDAAGDTGVYAGDVWTFTTEEFAAIDDFESYNDDVDAETTIYHAWIDGVTTTASGSQVGYNESPFAETTIIHGGQQAMPLAYDNSEPPYYSETEREFDTAQNWTGNGATELCVWTRGYPALTTVAVAEAGGKINLTGSGADIWGTADEFTYGYKTLEGDGSIVARVTSIGPGTNTWAKGGVMIRNSVGNGSPHAMMAMTANTDGAAANGASFQYRATANSSSGNADSTVKVAAPYWVKIERIGSVLRGLTSADGKTWAQVGTTEIIMEDSVLIGLCVTSHQAGEDRTYQFDSITTTGTVTGVWQGAVVNSGQYNSPANLYLTVEDSSGKTATATNATAVTTPDWTAWKIPLSSLTGVNPAKIEKLVIGIGDKVAPTAGGVGILFIDDIGYGRSAQ